MSRDVTPSRCCTKSITDHGRTLTVRGADTNGAVRNEDAETFFYIGSRQPRQVGPTIAWRFMLSMTGVHTPLHT